MSKQSKILVGLQLEQFLIELAVAIATPLSQDWKPAAVRKLQIWIIEIARYHFAGFSESQILDECCPTPEAREFNTKLYETVVHTLANVSLTDSATGEQFVPVVRDVRALFEDSRDFSIDHARTSSVMKPCMAFVESDYDTCATFGAYGAAAFGRHLFYQMNIIGNFRIGRQEEAEIAGCAAQNGLQISPWHRKLADLTLGNVTAADLFVLANDDGRRFQVRCFEGLRAYTNGDKENARRILSAAIAMPNNLPMEFLIAKADLDRC